MGKTRQRCLEIGPELTHTGKGRPPPRIAPHWEILDTQKRPGVDHVAVWGTDPLPLPDNAFDHVYSSHVLEHIWWYDTEKALREVLRILRPGGRCEVWVPDFQKIVTCYLRKKIPDKWLRSNPERDWSKWVQGRTFAYGDGSGNDAHNLHRAMFDEEILRTRMGRVGFVDVHRLKKPTGKDYHLWINLGVDGRKPK